ncbi:MAG: bifunctional DNA-formamidopyrimidine glycosylase/DNA-(apurinic or apyrimidinic site) lyase [Cryobacterium sp.]|nr:bifunctional DNA-formamidopyrimidine glycosylase/DNA-(apurinic or apyrimidinic site) lyase [Cryobacterium sp.]
MPELPEVEVVRAGLAPFATGAMVTRVEVFDERSLRRHPGPAEDFIDRLTGAVLAAPSRRGKFLWLPLDPIISPPRPLASQMKAISDGGRASAGIVHSSGTGLPSFGSAEALVAHLGMSGQVLLRAPGTDDPRTRIRIDLEHPEHGAVRLNFVDQRIFGSMAIDDLVPVADLPTAAVREHVPASVAHIARDPLDPRFDDARFLAALRKKRTGVKRALLDQTLVSGIGNIYADEALWASRIHYDQPTDVLSRPLATRLLAEVRAVLLKALAEGGTSFDTQYLNVNGESGYFSHSLNAYGQQGEPCPRCGRPIVREQFMNRGSHFCPRCQRIR